MKRIVVIIFSLSIMYAINSGEKVNSITPVTRSIFQCCPVGAAVPPCQACAKNREGRPAHVKQNQEKKRVSCLSQSQELKRCP